MTETRPSIRRAYVDTNRRQVHYREAGTAGGLPLVLLHQTASSSIAYVDLIEHVAKDFHVIALDTPGFGASDPLEGPVTIPALADAIVAALEALGVTRCWLYGHHTGASIAAQIAADHPSIVKRLVLSGPPYLDAETRERLRGAVQPVDLDPKGGHLIRAWERHLRLAGGAGMPIAQRELVLAFTAIAPEGVYGAVLDMDTDGVLARISCPTFMMGGELDSLRSGFEHAQARVPGSDLEVVPGAGIYITDEMPGLVADRLRDWFA